MATTRLNQARRTNSATINSAAVIVLALLLASLIIIFLQAPLTTSVGLIAVLLLSVCLGLALFGGWRGVSTVAVITGAVSVIAVSLLAQDYLGRTGGLIVGALWGLVLVFLFSSGQRRFIYVPRDSALMIRNELTDEIFPAEPPVSLPLVPSLQTVYATIPLYPLEDSLPFAQVHTNAGFSNLADNVKVHVRYRVTNPTQTIYGIPSRATAEEEIAKELKMPISQLEEIRTQTRFWEYLLRRQMRLDLEDELRMLAAQVANAVELFMRAPDYAVDLQGALKKRTERWGAEVETVQFENIEVGEALWKLHRRDRVKERQEKETDAEIAAHRLRELGYAVAASEAQRLELVLQKLKEQGVELPPDVLISAIRNPFELIIEGDFTPLARPPEQPKPPGDKKDDKK
jgi:hypothetical protein